MRWKVKNSLTLSQIGSQREVGGKWREAGLAEVLDVLHSGTVRKADALEEDLQLTEAVIQQIEERRQEALRRRVAAPAPASDPELTADALLQIEERRKEAMKRRKFRQERFFCCHSCMSLCIFLVI